MKRVQFVGLDVHADTIAVAVAEPGGTVRSVGVIPNRPESVAACSTPSRVTMESWSSVKASFGRPNAPPEWQSGTVTSHRQAGVLSAPDLHR